MENTHKIELTKTETDVVWRLIYNTRGKILDEYGKNILSDQLGDLLSKFIFPDFSSPAADGEKAARCDNLALKQENKK